MQGEDDLRGPRQNNGFLCALNPVSFMYFTGFVIVFLRAGWTLQIKQVIVFNGLQAYSLTTIYNVDFALVLLALSCLGNKRSQNEKLVGLNSYCGNR
jgi:hypothetical protein